MLGRSLTARIAALFAALWVFIGFAAAQTLLRDSEIEEFLWDYTEPLLIAAELEPEAVQVYLVGDPSLNAFVTAGQRIFIHTGLITAADTPNQIEGVIAHEIGHIKGGHQQRGRDAMARASRPAMLSLVIGAAAIAAGAPPEAGFGIMGIGQNAAIGNYLAYSRGQESAADQAGLAYLQTINRSGEGLVQFFDKLSNRQLISSRRPEEYLLTHPLALTRMNRLKEQVDQEAEDVGKDSEEDIQRLRMIQAKINGFMRDSQSTMRAYPLADQEMPARYARAVAYYRSSQLDFALREINRLIEAEPDNPFFQELKGQMLFEHGQLRESVAPHRRSVELGPQFALLKINLARSLIAQERQPEVEEGADLLRAAIRQEPDNSFAWRELARAYALMGDETLAALSQAEALFAIGNTPDAHRFASLARDDLEPGTPEHLRALDIIRASEDDARRARRNRDQRRVSPSLQ